MKHESLKKLRHRALALLLAVLMLVQTTSVAFANVSDTSVPAMTKVEVAGTGTILPDFIFSDNWNTEYDILYHLASENYTYNGQAVTFPDENTVQVGETSYTIRNTVTSVNAVLEDGKTKVTFDGIKTPVGSIPGEWNSNWGDTFAIHGNVNGQPVPHTEASSIQDVQLVIDTPQSGSYTFTQGKIYEAANEFSNGYDFGNGVVTKREFGYLPEVHLTVEVPSTPPVPQPPASNAPFTAKIGDNVLTIKDGGQEYCEKTYSDVQTYTIMIPEGETANTFTLYGEGLSYVKGGGCNDRIWDIKGSVELDILDGKTYHFRKGWTETFHIEFQKGDTVTPAPKVPEITAKIGDTTLKVAEITKMPLLLVMYSIPMRLKFPKA